MLAIFQDPNQAKFIQFLFPVKLQHQLIVYKRSTLIFTNKTSKTVLRKQYYMTDGIFFEHFRNTTYHRLLLFPLTQHYMRCKKHASPCTHINLVLRVIYCSSNDGFWGWIDCLTLFPEKLTLEGVINSWNYGIRNGCTCRLYLYNKKFERVTNSYWLLPLKVFQT